MIGNLLLLSLTALLGGACLYPVVEDTHVSYAFGDGDVFYDSPIDHLQFKQYYQSIVSFTQSDLKLTHLYTVDISNGSNNRIDMTPANDLRLYSDVYSFAESNVSTDPTALTMAFVWTNVAVQQNLFVIRFFVPYTSNVDTVEFALINSDSSSFYLSLSDFDNTQSFNFKTGVEGNYKNNYYRLTDMVTSFTGSNSPVVVMESLKLSQFCLALPINMTSFTMELHWLSMAESLDNIGYTRGYNDGHIDGFNDGYSQGYNEGLTTGNQQGYASGYSEGLAFAQQNASFNALFGAVADTPIVFLRSLFNFDLFGMNMFIIIMSLLTGILILYVIKKVWR